MTIFREYDWPGNVRELEHALEHACILCKTPIITVNDLPLDLLHGKSQPVVNASNSPSSSSVSTPKLSLADALSASGGNKARAARLLGISRMTLYRQLGAAD
ncbi:MAG: helix-turn-helix domain-containing protein [Desulfuromonadaceae bacterium]|nr:helix-turn-helix domain-containing protein [Desulfuromonadaceae bacterium]